MPRRQRVSKRRHQPSDAWVIWACDGALADGDFDDQDPDRTAFLELEYFSTRDELADLWRDHGERALAAWVKSSPGTRPKRWWRWFAPEPIGADETEAEYLRRNGLLLAGELT